MKSIKEIATQAAEVILFEQAENLTMLDITVLPPDGDVTRRYSIRLPKAFLEEVYRLGVEEGKIYEEDSKM